MAKRVFFSFHYQDVIDFRATDREAARFFDASIWGNAELSGDIGIKRVINGGLDRTSVTCVLVGSDTFARRWVRYEIMMSLRRNNSILAVHINSTKGRDQRIKLRGLNPLDYLAVRFSDTGLTATLFESVDRRWREYTEIDGRGTFQTGGVAQKYCGKSLALSEVYQAYDWVAQDGYRNFGSWVG